jgi:hypothetical protein
MWNIAVSAWCDGMQTPVAQYNVQCAQRTRSLQLRVSHDVNMALLASINNNSTHVTPGIPDDCCDLPA